MKANKKYKGKGGYNQIVIKLKKKRDENKSIRKQNKIENNKIKLIKPSLGYIHMYRAEMTDRTYTFADLHKIKLVDTISIYSRDENHIPIDNILKDRKNWPFDNEIHYIDYKHISTSICPSEQFDNVRKRNFWGVEVNEKPVIIEKSLLSPDGVFKIRTYTCCTTLQHLQFLQKTYGIKGWKFTIKGKTIIVTNPYDAKSLEYKRNKSGGTVTYIYDKKDLHKSVTNSGVIRKTKRLLKATETKPRHQFEHDPKQQRLVCITDGISVHRGKMYKLSKVVNRFPNKIRFCTKSEYYKYLNEISANPHLPKDKREVVRKLSVQGDKKKPEDTRTRKERRLVMQKKKLYSRMYFSQFVKPNEKWVEDSEDTEFENLVEYPSKTLRVRRNKYIYFPRRKRSERYYDHRLINAYKKYFAEEERRNHRWSPVESWSKQFMTLLKMVKDGKRECDIALKLSELKPGWNDKKMKRFITYLKLTKHGLNYKPNKKKQTVIKFEPITSKVKRIEVSKFPYYTPITVQYKAVNSEGAERILIEQNTRVQQKKIVQDIPSEKDPKINDTVVLCPIKDVIKWCKQTDYIGEEKTPWIDFVKVVELEKVKYKKIPFHLPKRKMKKKKWKHTIMINDPESKHMPF